MPWEWARTATRRTRLGRAARARPNSTSGCPQLRRPSARGTASSAARHTRATEGRVAVEPTVGAAPSESSCRPARSPPRRARRSRRRGRSSRARAAARARSRAAAAPAREPLLPWSVSSSRSARSPTAPRSRSTSRIFSSEKAPSSADTTRRAQGRRSAGTGCCARNIISLARGQRDAAAAERPAPAIARNSVVWPAPDGPDHGDAVAAARSMRSAAPSSACPSGSSSRRSTSSHRVAIGARPTRPSRGSRAARAGVERIGEREQALDARAPLQRSPDRRSRTTTAHRTPVRKRSRSARRLPSVRWPAK